MLPNYGFVGLADDNDILPVTQAITGRAPSNTLTYIPKHM